MVPQPRGPYVSAEPFNQYVELGGKYINLSALARDKGFNRSYLTRIFNSRAVPSLSYAGIIAEALLMTLPEFLLALDQRRNEREAKAKGGTIVRSPTAPDFGSDPAPIPSASLGSRSGTTSRAGAIDGDTVVANGPREAEESELLRRENQELRRQLEFLTTYPSIANGLKGERIVAALTGGVLTGYGVSHDVVDVQSGQRIEVKRAGITENGVGTKRWIWHRLLGRDRPKDYDWLVLMAEKDPDYVEQYPAELPWVFFLIGRADVDALTSGDSIYILTNLDKATRPKQQALRRHLVVSEQTFSQLFRNSAP